MKKFFTFLLFLIAASALMPVTAQTHYEYLFTEYANGARSKDSSIENYFNDGSSTVTVRFNSDYSWVFFEMNGKTSFSCQFAEQNPSMFRYEGPVTRMPQWQPGGVNMSVQEAANNTVAPIVCRIYFSIPSSATAAIDVLFNKDFSRMNVKPRGTKGVTHVFERRTASSTMPSEIL